MDLSRVFEFLKILALVFCLGVFALGWLTDDKELIMGSGFLVIGLFLRILWIQVRLDR